MSSAKRCPLPKSNVAPQEDKCSINRTAIRTQTQKSWGPPKNTNKTTTPLNQRH